MKREEMTIEATSPADAKRQMAELPGWAILTISPIHPKVLSLDAAFTLRITLAKVSEGEQMPKPALKTKQYYSWDEVQDWVDSQLEYNHRDVLGTHQGNPEAEHLDFWHWMLDQDDILNGCFISPSWWEPKEGSWQEPIVKMIQELVGEEAMWVEW